MKKYKWIIILLNLAVFLFFANRSIIHKEKTLEHGQLVLLKLAPKDPRSLMQGDYMVLRYDIARGNSSVPFVTFPTEESLEIEEPSGNLEKLDSLREVEEQRLDSIRVANINKKPEKPSKRGYCVIVLDSDKVAHRVRLQDDTKPLNKGEILIKYSLSGSWGNDINIGSESYFFEEGQAEKFETAQYGGLKVDNKGNSILIGLYDTEKKFIK